MTRLPQPLRDSYRAQHRALYLDHLRKTKMNENLDDLDEWTAGYKNGFSYDHKHAIWQLHPAHAYEWLGRRIGFSEISHYMNGFFVGQNEFYCLMTGALPQEAAETILVPGFPTDRFFEESCLLNPDQYAGKDQRGTARD